MRDFYVSVDIEGAIETPRQIGVCVKDLMSDKECELEINFMMSGNIYDPDEATSEKCELFCDAVDGLRKYPWIYWGGPEQVIIKRIFQAAGRKCEMVFIDVHKPWRNFLKHRVLKRTEWTVRNKVPRKLNGNVRSSLESAVRFVKEDNHKQSHDALEDARDVFIVFEYLFFHETIANISRNCSFEGLKELYSTTKNLHRKYVSDGLDFPGDEESLVPFLDCLQGEDLADKILSFGYYNFSILFVEYCMVRIAMSFRKTRRLFYRKIFGRTSLTPREYEAKI